MKGLEKLNKTDIVIDVVIGGLGNNMNWESSDADYCECNCECDCNAPCFGSECSNC